MKKDVRWSRDNSVIPGWLPSVWMLSYRFQMGFQRTEGKGLCTDINKAQRCLRSRGSSSKRSPKKMCIVSMRPQPCWELQGLGSMGCRQSLFSIWARLKRDGIASLGSQSRSGYGWLLSVVPGLARAASFSWDRCLQRLLTQVSWPPLVLYLVNMLRSLHCAGSRTQPDSSFIAHVFPFFIPLPLRSWFQDLSCMVGARNSLRLRL